MAVKKFGVEITSPEEIPSDTMLQALQAYSQIVLEQYYEEIGLRVQSKDIGIQVKEIN
jgi:hypothetical protein